MTNKPIVRICSWCQQINSPQFAKYATGIDVEILKEMKMVDEQVKANKDKFKFTHGICVPHFIQSYKEMPGMTDDKIQLMAKKMESSDPPKCLLLDSPLRQAFMKGLFTPELIQRSQQSQQQDNQKLTERFKKLAGIHC